MDTDLTMSMGALGLRGTLLEPAQQVGFQLALGSDLLWMVMDSAAAEDLAATEAEASRLRLVLEGSRPVSLAGGGSLTPSTPWNWACVKTAATPRRAPAWKSAAACVTPRRGA